MHTYSSQSSSRDPNVRAGDADREKTGEELRRHHAEGRLEPDEFQERIDRCYEAKTVGELRELLGDLPQRPTEPEPSRLPRFGPWLRPGLVIPVLLTVLLIGAIAHHGLWLLVPLFFLVRLMLWRTRHGGRGRWGMRRYGGGEI